MDGKIFNRFTASSVAITYENFAFDLQRFATIKVGSSDDIAGKISGATAGDTIKLTGDISVDSTITVDKKLTLDLNGKTLTTSANIGIKVNGNVEFTVDDSSSNKSGSIVQDVYNNGGKVKDQRSSTNAIKLEDEAGFTLNGGNITSKSVSIYANNRTNVTIGENAGTVKSENSIAVYFDSISNNLIGQNTLIMNGGKLLSTGWLPTIQVSGSFKDESTLNTITINAGTVEFNKSETATSDSNSETPVNNPGDRGEGAIFASGQTNLTIKDGVTVTSSHVGIEFRGGTLNVEGGTIESTNTNDKISYHETKRGTSFDDGVAIAVSRSSEEKDITVNIKGGTIQGYTALAVADPNSSAGTRDVTVNITGGKLQSTSKDTSDTASYLAANAGGNTATDKDTSKNNGLGESVALYTLKGKYAIVNFDKQVTVNILGTEVIGNIATMTKGGIGSNRSNNGYNIGTGNDFNTFNGITGDVLLVKYDEIGNDDFSVSKLGKGESFNRPDKDAEEWIYLIGSDSAATVVASIGPVAKDSSKLDFTMGALSGAIPSLTTAAEIDFTSKLFSEYNDATTFDGSKAPASFPLNITGNNKITEITAGAGNDTLKPGEVESIKLTGGAGADVFVFNGGNETITDYGTGDDSMSMPSSFRPANADFTATAAEGEEKGKIALDFDGNVLTFENFDDKEVSLSGGHVFATGYHAIEKQSITFTSVQSADYAATSDRDKEFATIDAAEAGAIKITGNALANRIVGSNKGGTLNGGGGNDKFYVTDRESSAKYLFEHKTESKELVEGFDDANDTLDITASSITEAKGSGSKLTLTISKDDDITLKSDVDIEKVSLNGGGYLTNSGYFGSNTFNLFQNAKGRIDLTDTIYKGADDTAIQTIDATKAEKQGVTLTADSGVKTVKLANNRKKDLFEYGGGTVSISGYEAGKDRINIADVGAMSLFSVDETTGGVSINAGGTNVVSIGGAAGEEVLIRDGGKSNSYSKFVFAQTGVLQNKAKKPTEVNIYSNVGKTKAFTADSSVKKIFLESGVTGVSIQSGNNKATLDASEASGVSLIGGTRDNKFISSAGADLFVYNGGKDNIQDFDNANDKISFGDGNTFDLTSAKISVSNKSLKFKFTNKNSLTLKSDGKIDSATIDDNNYTFSKNAVGLGGTVSLTSQFSGSYDLSKNDSGDTVDGALVKKNLTFKGTDTAESLVGGIKKTTFKGGGGNDIFKGGDGKDIFFYAKTDSGAKTIEGFDFTTGKDKIKIASGTITDISKSGNDIKFTTNGGSLTLENKDDTNVLIKTNNNFYWFADSETASKTTGVSEGDLITADTKVSKAQANATGYAIVDLGYSTNLVKSGVAVKAGEFTFDGGITKKPTTT